MTYSTAVKTADTAWQTAAQKMAANRKAGTDMGPYQAAERAAFNTAKETRKAAGLCGLPFCTTTRPCARHAAITEG